MLKTIDDELVGKGHASSTPDEAAALLRGEIGTEVDVTVAARGRERAYTLTRTQLSARSVVTKLVQTNGRAQERGEG